MNEEYGIKYEERLKQIVSFDDMIYNGNIRPTDIDGLIEFHDKAYIIFDVKSGSAVVPFGQKLALERMVCDWRQARKEAIGIICEHNIHDTNEQVIAKNCEVREYFNGANWCKPIKPIKLGEAIEQYLSRKFPNEFIKSS